MFLKTIYEVGRMIEDLKKERERLLERERTLCVFSAFDSEDIEKARPEYDYVKYQEQLGKLDKRIRTLTKEAVTHMVTTKIAEYQDKTILDLLLYMRQLEEKEERLYEKSTHREMERKDNPYKCEYEYINYDKKKVEEEYEKAKTELERIKVYAEFYIYELAYTFESDVKD